MNDFQKSVQKFRIQMISVRIYHNIPDDHSFSIGITHNKSYSKKYLKSISNIILKDGKTLIYDRPFFQGATINCGIEEPSLYPMRLNIYVQKRDPNQFSAKLTLSTDPKRNKLEVREYLHGDCVIFANFQGSDPVAFSRSNPYSQTITDCVTNMCFLMRNLNDKFFNQSEFQLPTEDDVIGKIMSESICKDKFRFFCNEDDYEQYIPIFYLSEMSSIFKKFYIDNTFGCAPKYARSMDMSKYCLEVVFKKILFRLSFSDVDFDRICFGDCFALFNFFCEFSMEFTYNILLALFFKLNKLQIMSEEERSLILNCEFPKKIKKLLSLKF